MYKSAIAVVSTLFCIASFGATQAELDIVRDKAVAWLVKNQAPDGRWTAAAGLDVQTTSTVIESLAASGYGQLPAFSAGVAWLINVEAGSVDALARQTIALRKAGSYVSSSKLATKVLSIRNAGDKGWGAYPGYLASIPDTPLALMALKATGTTFQEKASLAILFDAARYGEVGQKYWLYRLTAEASKRESLGEPVLPTALSVIALRAHGLSPTSLSEAVAFLKTRQSQSGVNQGGVVGTDGSYSAMDTALAAEAIGAVSSTGRADAAVQAALDFLKRTQSTAGHWGDAFSTAAALKLVGTNSTATVDSDGDKTPDTLEALLGTNAMLADSKSLLLTNVGANTPADGDAAVIAAWGLRGKSMNFQFSLADAATCCTNISGSLPSGFALAAAGAPLKMSLTGTPVAVGAFDSHWSYKTASGVDRNFELRLGIDPTLFVADADPMPLAYLFDEAEANAVNAGWQSLGADFNQDGRIDLLAYFNGANESFNRLNCSPCTPYVGPNWGYLVGLQDANGTFLRATPLLTSPKFNGDVKNAFVVDFNNDGKQDVILNLNKVTTASIDPSFTTTLPFRSVVALRNDTPQGGLLSFSDVTTALRLDGAPEGVLVLLDTNRDGALDVVMSNGLSSAKLYVFNLGLGYYEDKSTNAGLTALSQPVAIDFNEDTLIDIMTRDAVTGVRFLRNLGNGTFSVVSNETSLSSLVGAAISRVVPHDLNNDGRSELVMFETATIGGGAAQAYAGSRITVLEHGGLNASQQPKFGIKTASVLTDFSSLADAVNLGGAVADLDDDGLVDLVAAARDVSASQLESAVFKQQSNGSFVKFQTEAGLPTGTTAFDSPVLVDLNGDSKQDLIWPNASNTEYRLLNTGSENHAIDIELKGKASNRSALGALVQVVSGGVTQTRQKLPQHAAAPYLHFGLGSNVSATVSVTWPDGTSQAIEVTHLDRLVTITQP
jgi:FG-GAP-like repeat/ASPIC and UnbV